MKEMYALTALINLIKEPDTDFKILVDNTAVAAAFAKGRSSNKLMQSMVDQARTALADVGSRVKVVWISTVAMEPLADAPSRRKFSRDPFGLTELGVRHLLAIEPDIQQWRDAGSLVSMFGGPLNNPLQCEYFSVEWDLEDPLCRRSEAFTALDNKFKAGSKFMNGIFAYPPPLLILDFCFYLRKLGLEEGCQIFLIIPASFASSVLNAVRPLGTVSIRKFCGKSNKTFLHRQPKSDISLVRLSRWRAAQVVEEEVSSGE